MGFNAVIEGGFASIVNAPFLFETPLLPEAEVNRIRYVCTLLQDIGL